MKLLLISALTFLTATAAFADTYTCRFSGAKGNYRIVLKMDHRAGNKIVPVTIYLNNKVQISHETKQRVSSEAHNDSYGMTLRDSSHPQYKYDLSFDAMYLSKLTLTMPGIKNLEIDNCERRRN